MNELNVSLQHSILTLSAQGWSNRRIARELGLHRETVGRHLRLAGSKPAKVPPGSNGEAEPKPAKVPAGILPLSRSQCEPWREFIEQGCQAGLSAQRLYQDLVAEHQFAGSYDAVKRFVRRWTQTQPVPFVRMEVEPGAEAQVDFGQGAWVMVDGKRKRPHLFRVVLSHSRKGYSEVVWRQTTESFIRCLENGFRHYGGVTRTLVIDNLRAAVTRADWYDPEINPKMEEFCRHYGTVVLPTRPAMPRHKGKIEAGVKYGQNNALKGRVFTSLAEQNLFLSEWERTVADTRIHGTTRQQVIKVFNEVERSKLLPLPASLFPVFEEAPRSVHRDGYVEVQRAYYSVPPEYVGRQVWVRWESRLVRVFNQRREQIALHALGRTGQIYHRPTPPAFPVSARHSTQSGLPVGSGPADWQTDRDLGRSDDSTTRPHRHPSVAWPVGPGRQTSRGRAGSRCREGPASRHLAFTGFAPLLERAGPSPQLDFLETHPLIRSLDAYEALTPDCFNPQPKTVYEHNLKTP